jgi:hypothetical protein
LFGVQEVHIEAPSRIGSEFDGAGVAFVPLA